MGDLFHLRVSSRPYDSDRISKQSELIISCEHNVTFYNKHKMMDTQKEPRSDQFI